MTPRLVVLLWKRLNTESDPKKEETNQQTENLKLFFENRKLTQKKEETDPKKKKTDQQIKNLKLLLKTRNGPQKKRKPINKQRI